MICYHGGSPKLRIGKLVLPPAKTGADHSGNWGARGVHNPEKVYVTPEPSAAAIFASLHPSGNGKVWKVETIGEVEYDEDCSELGLSYTCDAARIIGRVRVKAKTMKRIREAVMQDTR